MASPLSPSTVPSAISLYESDGTHQHNGLATYHSSTPIKSAAAVVALPPRATVSPHPPSDRVASVASTISSPIPRFDYSSTRSRYSILDTYSSVPVVSSHLRTSSSGNTIDSVSTTCNDKRVCEQAGNEHIPMAHADEKRQHQHVSRSGDDRPNSRVRVGADTNSNTFPITHSSSAVSLSAESSLLSKTSRQPMAPRELSFLKKRSSLYSHQSMAQSDSQIDHPGSYSTTDISSNNKRQFSSVLASISSTFLGIGNSSRYRSHSDTSSVSLATIRTSSAVSDSVAFKRGGQTDQIACVLPSPTSITPVSDGSAHFSTVRPFSHMSNTGRLHPMSTLSHSHSTPTLLSCNQASNANEPYVVRRTGCICRKKHLPGPCLFHKKLPSIPVAQLDGEDPAVSVKEKKKSNRISVISTAASIRSFVASMKKSRSRAASVQSLAEIDKPSSRESQLRSQSNTLLPSVHPQESTLNHISLFSTTRNMGEMESPSIVGRAIKRRTGADVPLTGKVKSSVDRVGFQQAKCQAIYCLKGHPLITSYHDSEQRRSCADRLYLCPKSDPTSCLAPPFPFAKATIADKDLMQRMPSITRIRQAAESTPNLSLHGGAHVFAVNAQAEIIVHPHIAKDSTTSRRGGLGFNTNSTPDLPSISRSWSLMLPPPSTHNAETYHKENATFFEPFQEYSHGRDGQASRYVSFHFDLGHLEKTEQDTEDDLALATKVYMGRPEQDTAEESENGDNEYEVTNPPCVSSSPPTHPYMSLPNGTLSTTDLHSAYPRHRAILPPPPPPPHSIPHEYDLEDCARDGDEDPFQTLHQHFRTSNRFAPTGTSTSASASSPSLHLPFQPQSDQRSPFKRFFGYGKNGLKHRDHYESLPGAQGAANSSTVSLPAILSSFLPPSASTTTLPLHSNQNHLGTEQRLSDRGARLSGSKWKWMWWKNGSKASNAGKDVGGQESHKPRK